MKTNKTTHATAFLLVCILATSSYAKEKPVVNIPQEDRCANWRAGSDGSGSCVHASTIMLLRWQGMYQQAALWKKLYEGGEYFRILARKLDANHIQYAWTRNANVDFLAWCVRTRRGCVFVCRGGTHVMLVVDIVGNNVGILDCNDIGRIQWIPWKRFYTEWKQSGGDAVSIVHSPAAPLATK